MKEPLRQANNIKVFATDMDGTLLNTKGKLSLERLVPLLDEMEEKGILFVVATGNSFPRMKRIFGDYAERIAFVLENGGHLIRHNQTVFQETLSDDLVNEVLDFFEGHHHDYRIMLAGVEHLFMVEEMKVPEFMKEHITQEDLKDIFGHSVVLDDFSQRPNEPICKMNFIVEDHDLAESIAQRFNDHFTSIKAVTSGYGAVDIIATEVDKAFGINEILREEGWTAEQVVTFGDSANDFEMLEMTPYSCAVSNAPQIVQDVAQYLIPSNDEDGVLRTIETVLKGL